MRKAILKLFAIMLALMLFGACAGVNKSESTPESTGTLEIYNSKKDFIYVGITMQQADALFGEVIEENIKEDLDWGGNHYPGDTLHKYKGVWCKFQKTGEQQDMLLTSMTVFSPDYAPVRGIKVGDSIDSVLAKFPNENQEMMTNEYGENYKFIYGAPETDRPYGKIEYEEGLPVSINFSDSSEECGVFALQLDSNLCVSSIFISYAYR